MNKKKYNLKKNKIPLLITYIKINYKYLTFFKINIKLLI